MIDGRNFLDQPVKNYMSTYHNTISQGNVYTTGYLLDYHNFNKNYKLIAIDLSKHQARDVNPKAI